MKRTDALYQQYLQILEEELRPAMGCTEPIALAYAGAKARELLNALPDRIQVWVSGNIIKNVKSVVVPNTGGLHGIAAAVCAGVVAGKAEKQLEVISCVSPEEQAALKAYMQTARVEINPSESELVFDIELHLYAGEDMVRIRIVNHHTNIVHLSKNGDVLLDLPITESSEDHLTDKSCLCMEKIVEFADCLDPEDVRRVFDNVYAMLSPGGRFIFDLLGEGEVPDGEPFTLDYSESVRAVFRTAREPDGSVRLSISVFDNGSLSFEENILEKLHAPDKVRLMLREAGFEVIRFAHRLSEDEGADAAAWFVIAGKDGSHA